ncbi:aminotransferase class I/II-fold pyridoxal phosphate-dependent enzyme, partial [archaeon]|nr:aminotransferase class I/II-fold pyridoxal phosphate-dependent enzyme [archaeon]
MSLDEKEKTAVRKALDDGRLGPGKYCKEFEQKIAKIFEKNYGISTNSGSSANLIALELFNFPKGSEIITPATTFATTVAPIVQTGFIPVFVDVELGSNLMDLNYIEGAISDKTVAVMVPELIGNLIDMKVLRKIADEHNLVIIDDSCDTLGGKIHRHSTGFWSDASTTSFFASHIITAAGTGGMVTVNKGWQRERALVFRDWGRVGDDSEEFEKRFNFAMDGIPYDVKFSYAEIGYNLKLNEISAAFGIAQLEKLIEFTKKRKENFDALYKFFKGLEAYFILPKWHKAADVNWLAFPLTIRDNRAFNRYDLLKFLEDNQIQTRVLFSGNILRHPAYKNITHRRASRLDNADKIMEDSFWIG